MEEQAEAHSVFNQYHKHSQHGADFSMFHKVSKTGVIYATSRANAHGFSHTDSSWANMGQVSNIQTKIKTIHAYDVIYL